MAAPTPLQGPAEGPRAIEHHLAYLKLSFIAEQYADLAIQAAHKAWSHVDYLATLVAGEAESPEQEVHVSLAEEALHRALEGLSEREREVLTLRYGLGGGDPASLEEIGRRLSLTRERVRQIEAQALERLAVSRELEALNEAA